MFKNFKKGINSVFNEPHILKIIAVEFKSYIVVTSQGMNKKMGLTPPLVVFTNK
jgi:hypothetical protein